MKEPRIEDPDFDTSGLTAIEMPMTQSPAVAISKPAWDLPNVKYSGTVEVTLTIGADGRHTENFKSTGIAKLDAYLKSFLSRWRWSPGKIDAKPVMSKKKIHLIFAQ